MKKDTRLSRLSYPRTRHPYGWLVWLIGAEDQNLHFLITAASEAFNEARDLLRRVCESRYQFSTEAREPA